MGRRSIVAAFSIFVHALVLLLLMTADLWRPISEWPTPHIVMAFEPPRVVRLDDIRLPPQSPRTTASRPPDGPVQPREAAPVAESSDVLPEIRREEPIGTLTGDPGPIGNPLGGPEGNIAPPPASPPPAPQPKAPVRLHSGIKPPQRLVGIPPVYPMAARAAHKEGLVILEATIDEQGNVTETRLLRSIPLLDEAAVAAVRQWKFSPTLLNGVPVPIVMTVTVNFTLTQ
jgi:protein TonB